MDEALGLYPAASVPSPPRSVAGPKHRLRPTNLNQPQTPRSANTIEKLQGSRLQIAWDLNRNVVDGDKKFSLLMTMRNRVLPLVDIDLAQAAENDTNRRQNKRRRHGAKRGRQT